VVTNDSPLGSDPAEDPFLVLGVAPSLDLTPADVAAAHLRASARVHPDRARDPVERDRLLRESAALGSAKRTLQDPVLRAEALLRLRGVPAVDVPLSPAFLMETLELREAIDAAAAAADSAALGALRLQAGALQRAALDDLRVALAGVGALGGTAGLDTAAAEKGARAALARLRYAARMVARLDEAL
jgi:DnaJ-domain-containing protein 1